MTFFRHVFFPVQPKLREKKIDGKRHYVSPNGKVLPSVTTVLSSMDKDGIKAWRDRIGAGEADKISSRALVNGTELHSIIENFLNNKATESFKNIVSQRLFSQVKQMLIDKVNNIRAQETHLYSEKIGIAGKPDCIADWGGVLS